MEESTSSNSIQTIDKNLDVSTSCSSADMKAFEDQIENLKAVVDNLKEEIEKKEISIAKLAREKEKLSLDLSKQKRLNNNIRKQLEDERNFYFQEKEIFCQEMNEMKGLKEKLSSNNDDFNSEKSGHNFKEELENIKKKLGQTLEANYNLSIKFLRIKNTKSFLKNELCRIKMEHEKIFNDFKTKIEMMSSAVTDIVDNKYHMYASPSNRKYVQLVRQNSSLVHENLCLQMEIGRLNSLFDRIKLKQTKSETNNRLKYIHSLKPEAHASNKDDKREKKKVRITTEDKGVMANENPSSIEKCDRIIMKCYSNEVKISDNNEPIDTFDNASSNEPIKRKHIKKTHKASCRKHSSRVKLDEISTDKKQETDLKEDNLLHESRIVKLSSINEIDENENFVNRI
ncbi:hypothetical protein WA026_022024 [Henosepilachna vigintioctopunctata]